MTRDVECLTCGRRGPWSVVYIKPGGGQYKAMGLCSKRCRELYNGKETAA